MAGNFDNCTLGGAVVEMADYGGSYVDLGYTDGDIEFSRSAELKKLIDGVPLQTVGQVLLKEEVTVKIPAVEITATNIQHASLNLAVTTVSGGTQTVSDASNTEGTFANNTAVPGGSTFEVIVLAGGTVASLVVENVAENVTYTVNDDYILDATNGYLYRNPGGAISSGATVRLSYTWQAVSAKRIKLGTNLAVGYKKVKLTHTSPVSGNVITIELWKCLAAGTLPLSFKKEEFMKCNIDLTAVPDATNHSTEPVGYIQIVEN